VARKRGTPPAQSAEPPESFGGSPPVGADVPLPVLGGATSQFAEIGRGVVTEAPVEPRRVEKGVIVFDLDGTLLDDIGLISHVAGDVLSQAFGTPPDEARLHYLATTGMPFEAQLAQLYPEAPEEKRHATAVLFHERKVREAYAHAGLFPEVPKLVKELSRQDWTLAVSTGAERETADLLLEREGLRYWFEGVLGSGQGTKREHLVEYQRRYPGVPVFLVGDSRFDMEAAGSIEGVVPVARASSMHGWTLTPDDLRRWGAAWADYSLSDLPRALERLRTKSTTLRPKRRVRAKTRTRT
jgi:phosphoglycolate phosphatase-like HAD superfamily hydrolase